MSILKIYAAYLLLNTLLWFLIMLLTKRQGMHRKASAKYRLRTMLLSSSLVMVCAWLLFIHSKIGFLPYGPDTVDYTHIWYYLAKNGRWDHFIAQDTNPYYRVFHTSSISIYILNTFIHFIPIAYFAYLLALLISVLLTVSLICRALGELKLQTHVVFFLTAVFFLATPPLMGDDALQQYVSMVFALLAISAILLFRNVSKAIAIFGLIFFSAIMTHLTSLILLFIIIISLSLTSFKDKRKIYFQCLLIALFLTVIYNVYSAAAYTSVPILKNISKTISDIIFSGSKLKQPIIARAYGEIESSIIWLYSWTLLLALGIAYVAFNITLVSSKINILIRIIKNLQMNPLFNIASISCSLMFMAKGLRILGVDIYRYEIVPAYYALLILSVIVVTRILTNLNKEDIKMVIGLLLLISLIVAGLYSGLQDPHRMPWNGGLRLAPVTYLDRIELIPVAIYSAPYVKIFAWHDVYVPKELSSARTESIGTYYPIHSVLLKVAKGILIQGNQQTKPTYEIYFILPKVIASNKMFKHYNIMFNGNEHLLVMGK